jgi:hypothetical protein
MPYRLCQLDRAANAYLRASRTCRLPGKQPGRSRPAYTDVLVFAPSASDIGKRREIDIIASRIGSATETTSSHRHYQTSRRFGPVEYRAVAIPADENKEPCP